MNIFHACRAGERNQESPEALMQMGKRFRARIVKAMETIRKAMKLDNCAEDVLAFWFVELKPEQWWRKDQALDEKIRNRFGELHQRAKIVELYKWRESTEGRLAEILLLDQFSRNIHRDNPLAFACDPLALGLAQEAIASGFDATLEPAKRAFLFMPYMHSESILIQDESVRLFKSLGQEDNLNFALKHQKIIARFGRFPHRNSILGRPLAQDEEEFLNQPGSSF